MEDDRKEGGEEENGVGGGFRECCNSFRVVVGRVHGTDGVSGWKFW
jgi:hypothetical protein